MKWHHDVVQGSQEWLSLRAGIATASEFSNLVTPKMKVKTGGAVDTYLRLKLAERWLGSPLITFSGGHMEQGSIRESEAMAIYEFDRGVKVDRVGFVTTDDGRAGCSPDGIIDGECGLEAKCPMASTHTGYLLDGVLPDDYIMQVQGGMYITGYSRWVFISYCRNFPPFILTVERDETAQEAIAEAVAAFNEKMDAGWARLCEINGGPPKPKKYPNSEARQAAMAEAFDLSNTDIL